MVATYPGRVSGLTGTLDGTAPSRAWLAALRDPLTRDEAAAALHVLLLRAARFELARRRHTLPGVPRAELEDLAVQAADDALVAVLAKLHTFRGESRFTTWAYKFAVLEAAVAARKRAWRDRDVTLDDDPSHPALRDRGPTAHDRLEETEMLAAIRAAMPALSPRQREVLVAYVGGSDLLPVVARALGMDRETLKTHLRRIRAKYADAGRPAPTRRDLYVRAVEDGLVPPPGETDTADGSHWTGK
jgi:RNA polymerase sigma-70 factor (ECF subfamily)